jgi:phage-related protein
MLIGLQPKPTPEPQIIEVEKYIIKESEKKFDSLAIELVKSKQKIKDLENKKHEKIKNHKPLERVIITDSARQSNVNRFFR